MLECLKYSVNSMVLCYDLSLCGKISTILFGFFLLSFVFYGNMCVYNVCGFTSLTRKGECCHYTSRNSIRSLGRERYGSKRIANHRKLVQPKIDTKSEMLQSFPCNIIWRMMSGCAYIFRYFSFT